MLVYRIEHTVTGQGPYNPGVLPEEHRAPHAKLKANPSMSYWDRKDAQPVPEDDGLPPQWGFPAELFFGFDSPEALAAWFGEDYVEKAAAAGFVAAVYYVPFSKVLVGGHQVAFPRADAHRVRTCTTFDELRQPFLKEATA